MILVLVFRLQLATEKPKQILLILLILSTSLWSNDPPLQPGFRDVDAVAGFELHIRDLAVLDLV